jgi:hypothetical protein
MPLLSSPRAPIVIGALGARLECPHVRMLPPIETPVTPPFREEERLFGDQGAFHRQQSAVCTSIARCDRERIGLPSRRSDGRSIAKRLHTVPSGDDEPRLSMPWLGRASAFFTNRAA